MNEELGEQAEQSYTMTFSPTSNSSSLLGCLAILTIVGVFALNVKKKHVSVKNAGDFYRMEDDTISAMA